MPSSITLTVSHLPTSASFFLSALQPLNYAYRGRSDNTIGFGSTLHPSTPPDFWITQEIPGVPAGAAHIAFQAPSTTAVQHFFTAALKAGGKIHGEPAVRDDSGYYSAAVIDFDGNSIEAVFRPSNSDGKENDVKSTVSSEAMTKAVSEVRSQASRAPPSVAESCISRSALPSEAPTPARKIPGDMVEGIVSVANVARNLVQSVNGSQPSPPRPTGNGDGNVILGTLLGVAAGAALHYAFSHDKDTKTRPGLYARSATEPTMPVHHEPYDQLESGPKYITLEDNDYASTIRPNHSTAGSYRNSAGNQRVYATGFGNGSIAPSKASKASQRTSAPRMIEAPPLAPPSTFHHAPQSQISRSSSHHPKAPSMSPSHASRPSTTRRASERSIAEPPVTTVTSRHVLRTTSESQIHRTSTYPPPSAAATARTVTATIRPAPLSEANLARVTSASTAPAPSPSLPLSLHSKNKEPEAYPIDIDGRSRTSKSRSKSGSRHGSKHGSSSKAAGSTSSSKKMDLEVTPEDSVSQVSSVRSASTVRQRSRK
ncbi:hypothetical protein GJ744_005480 [Endocarpon pusillum]|uniref:VOC domain-containing protein n=1 Tax=Endocarpon pusillum TaxID=364733 RepID=A0A8H7A7G7_9EURO|nr:hypothetical protein GJ744_005480 [Endocarpon pusillum]